MEASKRIALGGDVADRVPKHPMPMDRVGMVSELVRDYVAFTPALLYIYTPFGDRLWRGFMDEHNVDLEIYHYRFEIPLFRGLETSSGSRDWNHVLWFVSRPWWRSLEDYLLSIQAVAHEPSLQLYAVGSQDFDIPDIPGPAVTEPRPAASLPIVVLGVSSSWAQIGLRQPRVANGPVGRPLPELIRVDPTPRMTQQWKMVKQEYEGD